MSILNAPFSALHIYFLDRYKYMYLKARKKQSKWFFLTNDHMPPQTKGQQHALLNQRQFFLHCRTTFFWRLIAQMDSDQIQHPCCHLPTRQAESRASRQTSERWISHLPAACAESKVWEISHWLSDLWVLLIFDYHGLTVRLTADED